MKLFKPIELIEPIKPIKPIKLLKPLPPKHFHVVQTTIPLQPLT